MLSVQTFLFLLVINIVKSEVDHETMCKDDYKDPNEGHISVLEYCSDKLCIEKCCGTGEILGFKNKCVNANMLFKKIPKLSYLAPQLNYSTNILSSGDGKETIKEFFFVQNNRDVFNCTVELLQDIEYTVLEDGSLLYQDIVEPRELVKIQRLKYCMDYKLITRDKKLAIKIIIRQFKMEPNKTKLIEIFETVGVIISSFFLLLVLVVYIMLPDKKIVDYIVTAYAFSLLFAFITKLTLYFVIRQLEPPPYFCKIITPVVYFAFVSSIFWLSVFAYDGYLFLRPYNTRRYSKHEVLVKLIQYSLYAWGIPLLLTALIATLDNFPSLDIIPPPFQQCLGTGLSFDLYYKIPIGILLATNVLLFCMTLHNIIISRKKKTEFVTYAKLTVMMGVLWILELLPATDKLWMYILANLFNLLTGVILFYLYVLDKEILKRLCKKRPSLRCLYYDEEPFEEAVELQSEYHDEPSIGARDQIPSISALDPVPSTSAADPITSTSTSQPQVLSSETEVLATDTTPSIELDSKILEIFGEDPSVEKIYGKEIQTDLAVRLQHLATKGLSSELRKELIERYLPPSNCKLIDSPELNLEIKSINQSLP